MNLRDVNTIDNKNNILLFKVAWGRLQQKCKLSYLNHALQF